MCFLLDILPTDVLILIVNVWLDDCMKDVCALDVAIASKELRMRYILTGCLTIKKEGFMKQIRIGSDEETLMAVSKWKEKRGLDIKRIYFEEYEEHCPYLGQWGTLFPHLQEIEMHACSIILHHVLVSSLIHLRKLTLDSCYIGVSKEIVSTAPLLTNIEELEITDSIFYNDKPEGTLIPPSKLGEVFLWIAKCCPKLKICSLRKCTIGSHITIIEMIQQWPLLKDLKLILSSFEFVSSIDLDLFHQKISAMKKANLESISLDIFLHFYDDYDNVENSKHFLDILLSCCNVAVLRSLVLYVNNWPARYVQLLLQSIPNMHQMKHITIRGKNNKTVSVFADAVWNHCHTLETLKFMGSFNLPEDLMLFQVIATPNHFHLVHLRSLHLSSMKLADESIDILCNSVYAKQLTSLCLIDLRGVSWEVYQHIFSSFNQLQSCELILNHPTIWNGEEILQKDYYKELLSLLDALLNENCAFAKTLQYLKVNALCFDTNKWKDKQFIEEMLHDHVISYWKFPFPNLQSCKLDLQTGNSSIADLTMKSLLVNCPALHTLYLKLLTYYKAPIEFTKQREMIRRMREQYL